MPKAKVYKMTVGKTNVLVAYMKKIDKFMRPYGLTNKELDTIIQKEFIRPMMRIDMMTKPILKEFKKTAKELYDDVVEMEAADEEYDNED